MVRIGQHGIEHQTAATPSLLDVERRLVAPQSTEAPAALPISPPTLAVWATGILTRLQKLTSLSLE
jgi:hypothetical protein